MLIYDLASRKPVAEYVYATSPIPVRSTRSPPLHDNGVTSALYLKDGRLIVLERSFALGVGVTIQIFEIDTSGATDVLGKESLSDVQDVKPVAKKRLIMLKSGESGQRVDNIEGMAIGPMVSGNPTVLLAADNNFRRGQINQFIALSIPR